MPPKPKPLKDQLAEQRFWFASHRVKYIGQEEYWERCQPGEGLGWEPCTYEDVPDQIWSMSFKRGGWKFYTDRTRECDSRGFAIKSEG